MGIVQCELGFPFLKDKDWSKGKGASEGWTGAEVLCFYLLPGPPFSTPRKSKLSKDNCRHSLARFCYCSLTGSASLYIPWPASHCGKLKCCRQQHWQGESLFWDPDELCRASLTYRTHAPYAKSLRASKKAVPLPSISTSPWFVPEVWYPVAHKLQSSSAVSSPFTYHSTAVLPSLPCKADPMSLLCVRPLYSSPPVPHTAKIVPDAAWKLLSMAIPMGSHFSRLHSACFAEQLLASCQSHLICLPCAQVFQRLCSFSLRLLAVWCTQTEVRAIHEANGSSCCRGAST